MKIPDFTKSEDIREEIAEKYGDRRDIDNPPPKGDTYRSVHKAWGADINQITYPPLWQPTIKGALARHYIDESLTLGTDEDRTLYAPTLKPPEPCPLEVATTYRYTSGYGLERYVGIWDHNDEPGFAIKIYFNELDNDGWLSQDGIGTYYEVGIAWNSGLGEWVVYLHNFGNSSWPIIYSQEDDNYDHGGWDFYEGYYETSWPETPYLRAYDIEVFYVTTQSWSTNTWPVGYVINDWSGFSLEHDFISDYYDWYVGE